MSSAQARAVGIACADDRLDTAVCFLYSSGFDSMMCYSMITFNVWSFDMLFFDHDQHMILWRAILWSCSTYDPLTCYAMIMNNVAWVLVQCTFDIFYLPFRSIQFVPLELSTHLQCTSSCIHEMQTHSHQHLFYVFMKSSIWYSAPPSCILVGCDAQCSAP